MSTGILGLSALLCCLGQTAQDTWYINDRHFTIPISMEPARRAFVKQMVLYSSRDRGASWPQEAVIGPDKDGFVVHVAADGEYWYRVALIDTAGKMDPPDLDKAKETRKIVVDTLRPTIRIMSTQRQGDVVVVRWEIQESNPDPKSLKLRYRPAGSTTAPWSEPVAVTPGPTGEARAKVNTNSALVFRLEMKDLAGNFSFEDAEVAGELAAGNVQADAQKSAAPPPPPSSNNVSASLVEKTPVTLPPPPPVPPGPPVTPAPAPKPGQQVAWDSSGSGPKPFASEATKVPQPVASTQGSGVAPPPGAPTVAPPSNVKLPPLQVVNHTQITLQYELSHVGPAGVGKIEMWLTRDDGQTWEPYKQDTTVNPSMRGGKYTRTLELPGQGVFGLSLVVYNQVNRARRPAPGDPPQMRIEVDMTPPEATLNAPEPDPFQRDAVILSWDAHDKNLSTHPITLEWAPQRQGPWTVIQGKLANTGKYSWQVPQGVPAYAYLRLRVRDKAGNEAVAVTKDPQPIDVSEPEGQLIGVTLVPAEKQQ
jgi:hypothetical protein